MPATHTKKALTTADWLRLEHALYKLLDRMPKPHEAGDMTDAVLAVSNAWCALRGAVEAKNEAELAALDKGEVLFTLFVPARGERPRKVITRTPHRMIEEWPDLGHRSCFDRLRRGNDWVVEFKIANEFAA